MSRRKRSCSPDRRNSEIDQHYLNDLCDRLEDHATRVTEDGFHPSETVVLFNELLEAIHIARHLVPTTPRVSRLFAAFLKRRGAFNYSIVVRHLNALTFTREQLLDVYSLVGEVQELRIQFPHSNLRQDFDDLCLKWRYILEETPSGYPPQPSPPRDRSRVRVPKFERVMLAAKKKIKRSRGDPSGFERWAKP